jgi:basic membrane protein A
MDKKTIYILLFLLLVEFSINDISKRRRIQSEDKDKICFIFLHDEISSYDKNFIDAAKDVCTALGVEAIYKTNIDESEECYNTAVELAKQGCKAIFADSFGHEQYILRAAKEYPNIEFGHATGTLAHTSNLTNFHNAFASIYEGRYVTGIAAGMKLNEMIEKGNINKTDAKVGYIGAFPFAEVISGYTAFYLGVKSVCDSATMKVRYTNSWYDEEGEKEAAEKLIDKDGCKIISQHADSSGSPNVCESRGVPNVFYNGENPTLTKSYLISSRINWIPYFNYFINCTLNGIKMPYDWTGSLKDGSIEVYNASSLAVEGTQDAVNTAINNLKEGKIKVFNTSKFTIGGKTLSSYLADVDSDENFIGDTEVISNGYFHESEYRSAPYFNLIIDGISVDLDKANNETIYNFPKFKTSKKKGLSTGTIVAIILPIVAAVAFVVGALALSTSSSAALSPAYVSNADSTMVDLSKI